MDHRLKGKILIDRIFTEGKSFFVYPVKMIYFVEEVDGADSAYHCGVSVSKRNLKRAVDRNLIKRRMREALRIQINDAGVLSERKIIYMMLVYVGKEIISYDVIYQSVKRNLKKINSTLSASKF
ncbi:MAG: ribonuclease P protein component [Saprospiraceae bacterium]|nr:ribonuclease P protein component [Saprospiraceae bacterium]